MTAALFAALMVVAAPAAQAAGQDRSGISLSDIFGGGKPKNPDDKQKPNRLTSLLNDVTAYTSEESPEEEQTSGDAIAAVVLGAAPVWRDEAVQRYVNLVGRNLASHVERRDVNWRFAVLDTPSINGMAFPGGIVVITRGLYEKLTSEDELAAVLAHEIAHVNRKHQWKVIRQQKLVALAGDSVTRNDKSKVANMVADLGTRVIARGLDKTAEFEADRDAVVIAARAGYDSSALIAVMDHLRALKPGDADTALLFATHPSPAQRIDALAASDTPALDDAATPSPAAARIRTVH